MDSKVDFWVCANIFFPLWEDDFTYLQCIFCISKSMEDFYKQVAVFATMFSCQRGIQFCWLDQYFFSNKNSCILNSYYSNLQTDDLHLRATIGYQYPKYCHVALFKQSLTHLLLLTIVQCLCLVDCTIILNNHCQQYSSHQTGITLFRETNKTESTNLFIKPRGYPFHYNRCNL